MVASIRHDYRSKGQFGCPVRWTYNINDCWYDKLDNSIQITDTKNLLVYKRIEFV